MMSLRSKLSTRQIPEGFFGLKSKYSRLRVVKVSVDCYWLNKQDDLTKVKDNLLSSRFNIQVFLSFSSCLIGFLGF